jgi:hypothetical protein
MKDDDKLLELERQSTARWLEYFKNIGGIEHKPKQDDDWEPLHIGFRDTE